MSETEKIEFLLGTIRPMAEATFPYLTSIIGWDDPRQFALIGSGFLLRSRGRRLLVTADHVIRQASGHQSIGISTGFGSPPFPIAPTILESDLEADLAVLELPSDYRPTDDKSFLDPARIDSDPGHRYRDILFSQGFPGQRSRFIPFDGFGRGLHLKSLPCGAMQRDDPPPDLRTYQFAIHYEANGGIPGEPRGEGWLDPKGMSGAPVFRVGGFDAPVSGWSPDRSRLVGVLTGWDQEGQFLIATGIQRLISLIGDR